MKKASELCESCRTVYDSWNDMTPETARAIKRSIGRYASLQDLIRNTTDAVLESCTRNHPDQDPGAGGAPEAEGTAPGRTEEASKQVATERPARWDKTPTCWKFCGEPRNRTERGEAA